MAERQRQIWAFQANPEVYDIAVAVRETIVDAWTIAPSDVQLGDLAVLWKAKGGDADRGVVGFGLVVSSPFVADDAANPYWKGPSDKQDARPRVLIRYITPAEAPFWERDHAWLATLNVARGQQTVFRVSREEWNRLTALVRDPETREWLRYEYPSEGEDWCPAEYELACRVYFEMLERERRREPYVKAEHRRRLQEALTHRTSLDYRFQNISWVLYEAGLGWIAGYKPARNVGTKLAPFVASILRTQQLPQHALGDEEQALVETPPPEPRSRAQPRPAVAVVIDYDELSRARREIGRRGEHFVAESERARLKAAGRPDLADRVEIVAQTQGDGLGYDVGSFEADGSPRLIEVKATTGDGEAPFYITVHELESSRRLSPIYWVYRVYSLNDNPRYFVIRPPLEEICKLEAETFRVSLKATER